MFCFQNKMLENSSKMEYNLYYKIFCNHCLVRLSERVDCSWRQNFWGDPSKYGHQQDACRITNGTGANRRSNNDIGAISQGSRTSSWASAGLDVHDQASRTSTRQQKSPEERTQRLCRQNGSGLGSGAVVAANRFSGRFGKRAFLPVGLPSYL
jgi:hypothetical protein